VIRFKIALPLILAFAVLAFTPAANASKLTVNCPNDPSTYLAIQDAVDAANPGDFISVCPGVYFENVFVNTPKLMIEAKKFGSVKLVPGDPDLPGITVAAPNVEIEGFDIELFCIGIFVGNPCAPTSGIKGTITCFGTPAITAGDVKGATAQISHNTLQLNVIGIKVEDVGGVVVDNNKLASNIEGIEDCGGAIGVWTNTYTNNNVQYNVNNGISISDALVIADGSTIAPTVNTAPFTSSISPTNNSEKDWRAVVKNNKLNNNGNDGLFLLFAYGVLAKQNTADYNALDGIGLEESEYNLIVKNTANYNGANTSYCYPGGSAFCDGIFLDNSSEYNGVFGNSLKHNVTDDLEVDDLVDNKVANNKCGTSYPSGLCH
jgi:parallel beta-helix repeat protein